MITTINEFKYNNILSNFKAYITIEKLLLLKEEDNNGRYFQWDLTKDVEDDIRTIDKLKLGYDQIKKYINGLLDKLHALPEAVQIKLFKTVVIAFLSFVTMPQMLSLITSYFDSKPTVSTSTVDKYKKVVKVAYDTNMGTIKKAQELQKKINTLPTEFSDTLVEFLKYEEGSIENKGEPVLTAYKLGDGMVTIGYGHAEPIATTKLIPNKTKISKDQAIDLLIEDIKEAQGQLDDILNDWKSQGIKMHITQGMYDSMISMIYNMGIGNFRKTDFIQYVKQGKYKTAAEKIKDTMISYPGHVKRRDKEAKLFAATDVTKFVYNV